MTEIINIDDYLDLHDILRREARRLLGEDIDIDGYIFSVALSDGRIMGFIDQGLQDSLKVLMIQYLQDIRNMNNGID